MVAENQSRSVSKRYSPSPSRHLLKIDIIVHSDRPAVHDTMESFVRGLSNDRVVRPVKYHLTERDAIVTAALTVGCDRERQRPSGPNATIGIRVKEIEQSLSQRPVGPLDEEKRQRFFPNRGIVMIEQAHDSGLQVSALPTPNGSDGVDQVSRLLRRGQVDVHD